MSWKTHIVIFLDITDGEEIYLMNQKIAVHRELILYILFGLLTTMINVTSYTVFLTWHINIQVAVVLSWFLAVLAAYITNKIWVFTTTTSSFHAVFRELILFFSARIMTLFVEMVIIWFGVTLLQQDPLLWKIIDNIVVVLVNYYFSKLVIFKKV